MEPNHGFDPAKLLADLRTVHVDVDTIEDTSHLSPEERDEVEQKLKEEERHKAVKDRLAPEKYRQELSTRLREKVARKLARAERLRLLWEFLEPIGPKEQADRIQSFFHSAIFNSEWGHNWDKTSESFKHASSADDILALIRTREYSKRPNDQQQCGFQDVAGGTSDPKAVVENAELVAKFLDELRERSQKELYLGPILSLLLARFTLKEIACVSVLPERTIFRRLEMIYEELGGKPPSKSRAQTLSGAHELELHLIAVETLRLTSMPLSEVAAFLGLTEQGVAVCNRANERLSKLDSSAAWDERLTEELADALQMTVDEVKVGVRQLINRMLP